MGKSRLIAAAAAALAVVMLGVDGGASHAGTGDGGACTQIGCEAGVSVSLKDPPTRAKKARICVSGECKIARKRSRWSRGFRCDDEPAEVRIKVAVFDKAGERLIRGRRTAQLRPLYPNGEDCPPPCYRADFKFNARTGDWERQDL